MKNISVIIVCKKGSVWLEETLRRIQVIGEETQKKNTIRNYFFIAVIITAVLFFSGSVTAQPYLDIAKLKYTNSPNTGLLNQNKNDVKLHYFSFETNLPLQFNDKKDAVIFSPFFENWYSKIINTKRQNYYSITLPVTLSKTIPNTKWAVLLTGIVRMNDSSINKKTKMQVGGAFIVSNKRNEHLTWKLGLYLNNDLFGVFVVPLAGLDWQINNRNMLFGVLPGNLTYEHKINEHFFYGATFRAITNAYGKTNGYWRIDENQLGIYLDTYFNKNFVLNIEAGHSLFRKIRTGIKQVSKYDADVNDNFYAKASFAYRIRFKK